MYVARWSFFITNEHNEGGVLTDDEGIGTHTPLLDRQLRGGTQVGAWVWPGLGRGMKRSGKEWDERDRAKERNEGWTDGWMNGAPNSIDRSIAGKDS